MIIGAADFFTVAIREFEDDSILLVHADTVIASEISFQLLQSIGGRYPQILYGCAGIQQIEFALHTAPEHASDPPGRLAVTPMIDVRCRGIAEAGDHNRSIPEYRLFMYISKKVA